MQQSRAKTNRLGSEESALVPRVQSSAFLVTWLVGAHTDALWEVLCGPGTKKKWLEKKHSSLVTSFCAWGVQHHGWELDILVLPFNLNMNQANLLKPVLPVQRQAHGARKQGDADLLGLGLLYAPSEEL